MRIVILCAGDATRWGGYLGLPKHLVPIHGEPLLHRTVRLVRELRRDAEILIAARPEDLAAYAVTGAITIEADLQPARFDADKFLSTRHHWAGQGDTVLLYGDCFFTRSALSTIVSQPPVHDWELFARFSGSAITGSQWPECFAFRIAHDFQDRFAHVGAELVEAYGRRLLRRIGGWEFYAALAGQDPTCPAVFGRNATEIDDWTEDFDTPAEFSAWAERTVMEGAAHVL